MRGIDKRFFTGKLIRRTVWVVFLGLIAVLLNQTLIKANRVNGYDFTSYLLSAKSLADGSDPYKVETPFPYIYPLFLAFILIPMTFIPYAAANILWFIINVSAMVASCVVLIKISKNEIKTDFNRHLIIPVFLGSLILFLPIQSNFLNGQVNLIVLFCCIMFFYNFVNEKLILSSLWLGAAIALKLLPAFFFLFLLLRKKYGMLMLTILFTALFCLLPVIATGGSLFGYYEEYFRNFLLSHIKSAATVNHGGQIFSLLGSIGYFFPSAPSYLYIRFLSFLTSLGVIFWIDIKSLRASYPAVPVWSFCAYLGGMLLLSPMSETHHLVFLIPPVLLISIKSFFDPGWIKSRITLLTGAFVCFFTILAKLFQFAPFYFVSLVIILTLLFLLNSRQQRAKNP